MTIRMILGIACLWFATAVGAAQVTIVDAGEARAAIFVAQRLMDDSSKSPEIAGTWQSLAPEDNRRRLRESVKDFAGILERMSGAKVEIVTGKPAANDKRIPILIGELASDASASRGRAIRMSKAFAWSSATRGSAWPASPTWRPATPSTPCSTSSAAAGTCPAAGRSAARARRRSPCASRIVSTGPYTDLSAACGTPTSDYRPPQPAGRHAAARPGTPWSTTVPKELRKTQPGDPRHRQRQAGRPPRQVDASARRQGHRRRHPGPAGQGPRRCKTFSLSPDDGLGWDESDDAKFDAGDFDPPIADGLQDRPADGAGQPRRRRR